MSAPLELLSLSVAFGFASVTATFSFASVDATVGFTSVDITFSFASVAVTFASTSSLVHVDAELVLLVASHVRIAHVIQHVAVLSRRRRNKVELDLGFLLQGQALDRDEAVVLWVSNHHPPTLLAFLQRKITYLSNNNVKTLKARLNGQFCLHLIILVSVTDGRHN